MILTQIALIALLAALVVLSGCFSSNKKDIEAFSKPSTTDVNTENYILQPPDEVEIHCTKVPEIHLQRQRIRPDGIISFEGIGEIKAAGRTPKELTSVLQEKIMLLYTLTGENPIDVRVVVFKSKVYYVIGQVTYPGSKDLTGRDTVLSAISNAKPTNIAWLGRIQIVRPSADKKTVRPKVFELNYVKMVENGDTSKNVLLQEGDIVYVPPTVLGAIGLTISEISDPLGRGLNTYYLIQGPTDNRN
jgi:protein involved in polysaccharide export with SLBB domain